MSQKIPNTIPIFDTIYMFWAIVSKTIKSSTRSQIQQQQ